MVGDLGGVPARPSRDAAGGVGPLDRPCLRGQIDTSGDLLRARVPGIGVLVP